MDNITCRVGHLHCAKHSIVRGLAAGGDAAEPAQIGPASGELLQRRRSGARQGGAPRRVTTPDWALALKWDDVRCPRTGAMWEIPEAIRASGPLRLSSDNLGVPTAGSVLDAGGFGVL